MNSSRALYLRLLSYVRPYSAMFGLAVLGMVAAAATEPLFPAMIRPLLDQGFGAGTQSLPPLVFAAAIVGIFVLRGLLTFTSSYCIAWVGNRVVLDLRAAMFARLVRFPARYFDDHSSGAVLSKVAYDVGGVTAAATTVLTVAVQDTIKVVGLFGFLLYLNWKLTLIAIAIVPPIALFVRLLSRRLRSMARGAQTAMGEIVHVLEETIDCHKVVKIFGGQDYESRRFERANQRLRGFNMRQTVPAALSTPVTHTLAAFAVAIIVYVALQESIAERATIGEFASFMTAMLLLLAPLKHLTELNAPLQRGLAAAESVFALIDTPVEKDEGRAVIARARGEIEFQDVSLTYPTRSEPALRSVSFAVRPGETVALVGGSGGGKTTLANLLPRFYSPDSGRVLLDGQDIQALTLDSLRANLALVSQDVVLFNDSIRANIAYGAMGAASEKEIVAAAEAAHAMDFIRETPQGLDTLIGENGMRLSGGQRQRLAIARALLKNAPVLILDEATSALDTGSERIVQDALEVLMRGRTTLVIAHRLSTIERADRILVLERGGIVETGTHAELLARSGIYAKLYRNQVAAERLEMSRPLRIVHTESSLGWGGQEIRILSESQGLMRRGHDVKLLCAPQSRIRAEAANWGVPVVTLPIDRKRFVGLGALIHWFGANASDIINTHSSTDSWLSACAQVAIGSPTRIVRTRHISARVPRNLLSRWLYQRATAYVVTTGEALKRELVERNRFSANRIESVPTGIDAGRFRPGERKAMRAKFGLPQDKILVGIVATLRSWKGHAGLLEAMARLPESIELVIVGDGPQREALEQKIAELGLRGRVRMQGQQADVLPWLRALDIFALPSYANEGVPQALVQAMLVELPCVTTAVGGIPEVAEHERSALVVPPQDAAALAAAIERLAGNEGLRRELGEAARKHCVEGYSYERMLERMESIYRNVSGVF